MDRNKKITLILSLINDERKSKRTLSARACNTVYDYCPGTSSDFGMCSVGAIDRCTAYDWGDCRESATDICKYDYSGCSKYMEDICETDYGLGCDTLDRCTIDRD